MPLRGIGAAGDTKSQNFDSFFGERSWRCLDKENSLVNLFELKSKFIFSSLKSSAHHTSSLLYLPLWQSKGKFLYPLQH